MTSQIDVVNLALLRISSRSQVSSINPSDGSAAGDAASLLWTPTFEMLGRAAHWNCFRKQVPLTLIKAKMGTPENLTGTFSADPPTPWLYSYAYPSDCLLERYIIAPSDSSGIGTPIFSGNGWASTTAKSQAVPFAAAFDTDSTSSPIRVILTNQSSAIGVYTVNQPDPSAWDAQFRQAMISSLAVWLIPALTGNAQMMSISIGMAEKIVKEARRTDGDEGLTIVDNIPDWISVRGTLWAQNASNFITPYGSLTWPST